MAEILGNLADILRYFGIFDGYFRQLSDDQLAENTQREQEVLRLMTSQAVPFAVGLKYAFQTAG
eukprot:COSAG06_NODE_58148_length_278_cov_0.569832_1_plen_63_part_10